MWKSPSIFKPLSVDAAGQEWLGRKSDLDLYLSHLSPTGASTLTRRKKGRRSNASRILSFQMVVITQCSRDRLVTWSSSESTVGKYRASDLFSTAVPSKAMLVNPCSFTRKLATLCLPEHMPGALISLEDAESRT